MMDMHAGESPRCRFIRRLLAGVVVNVLRLIPRHHLRKRWAKLVGPLVSGCPARTAYGFTMLAFIHDNSNRKIFEGSQDVVAEFIRSIPIGSTFIDVGANQGGVSLLASQVIGPTGAVLAFEPIEGTYRLLALNLEINGVENVQALNVAVGRLDSSLTLEDWNSGDSGQVRVGESGQVCSSIKLTPNFVASCNVGLPAFVKIDVEGYESEVIRGMEEILAKGDIEALVVEIDAVNLGRYGSSPGEVYSLLDSYGFTSDTTPNQWPHYDAVFRRDVEQ